MPWQYYVGRRILDIRLMKMGNNRSLLNDEMNLRVLGTSDSTFTENILLRQRKEKILQKIQKHILDSLNWDLLNMYSH